MSFHCSSVWPAAVFSRSFYLTLDARLMAVRVPRSGPFSLNAPPQQLFQSELSANSSIEEYAVLGPRKLSRCIRRRSTVSHRIPHQ